MASSKATSVEEYISELPSDRRETMERIRDLVLKNLPRGYEEAMNWGMITWQVPLATYPDTYNGEPLCYAALAAQKNYFSLYLMGTATDPATAKALTDGFSKAGKKLDMGKSCVRFKAVEDLPLDVIASSIGGTPPTALIAAAMKAHGGSRKKKK